MYTGADHAGKIKGPSFSVNGILFAAIRGMKWGGCCLLTVLLACCTGAGSGQSVIAYYTGNAADIDRYPIDRLTHLVWGFCSLKQGRMCVGARADSLAIRRLVRLKKKYPALKILVALGGWGGCRDCSATFATAAGRDSFAASVAEMVQHFGVDGVDIDWEYPSLAAFPGHRYAAEDKQHFTQLLRALRDRLGPDREITFAAAGFAPYLQGSIDWVDAVRVADRIHLMTYDFIGSHHPTTGHHAALFSTSGQEESADHAVRYLDSLGVPLGKVAIGVAFYGREFDGASGYNQGLYQAATFKRFLSMRQLRRAYGPAEGYTSYWDDMAQAPWRYNSGKKIFITYDDERSVAAKTRYARAKKLNGIFFWQLALDIPHGGLTDRIAEGLRSPGHR